MRDFVMFCITITILASSIGCNSEKKFKNISNIHENEINGVDTENNSIQADTYLTQMGNLNVTLVGHASLMFEVNGKVIHVDPYSKVADYAKLPKADLVLLTHEHSDHLDINAIEQIRKPNTRFLVSQACADSLTYGEVLNYGDSTIFEGVKIKTVPAYNIKSKKENGDYYHPKGRGNGYVLTFGKEKMYIAGDTENIPEMSLLKDIYIAFIPKNVPYTMTNEMFVDAVLKISPIYLYPYHFNDFNDKKILKALEKNGNKSKVLVRTMSHN